MDVVFKSPPPDNLMCVPAFHPYCTKLKYGQHGQPAQVIDIGETALDEQIFEEYLAEMRDHYTADKVCGNTFAFRRCPLISNVLTHLILAGAVPPLG